VADDDRSEYQRALRAVHAHQAVFAAEDIVTRAWLAELDAARRDALELVRALRMADAVSKRELRAALRGNDPAALAEAQQGAEETRRELDEGVAAAQALLARVDEQIERSCRAAAARENRQRDDLARLRIAWRVAYGSAEFVDES
jgi:hypothetical protein